MLALASNLQRRWTMIGLVGAVETLTEEEEVAEGHEHEDQLDAHTDLHPQPV